MLLPIRTLRRGPANRDVGAMPQLHLPQPGQTNLVVFVKNLHLPKSGIAFADADVLPQRVPLHQTGGPELRRGEEGGPMLSNHQVSPR